MNDCKREIKNKHARIVNGREPDYKEDINSTNSTAHSTRLNSMTSHTSGHATSTRVMRQRSPMIRRASEAASVTPVARKKGNDDAKTTIDDIICNIRYYKKCSQCTLSVFIVSNARNNLLTITVSAYPLKNLVAKTGTAAATAPNMKN